MSARSNRATSRRTSRASCTPSARGCSCSTLQRPEDLSILLEWHGFALDGARDGHLGLGFDLALQAVTTRGRSPEEVDRWILSAGEGDSILPPD